MQLHLRDKNDGMVMAWRAYFRDEPDVEISSGDIFNGTSADAIVSPANSFGFMDGGIDLAYTLQFGWRVQNDLQELLRNEHDGELPVGEAVIVATGNTTIPFCISAPTMRVPMNVAGTVNAYLAFRAALRAVKAHNATGAQRIERVLSPGLGTMVGEMPQMQCAKQMHRAWRVVVRGETPSFASIGDAKDAQRELTA